MPNFLKFRLIVYLKKNIFLKRKVLVKKKIIQRYFLNRVEGRKNRVFLNKIYVIETIDARPGKTEELKKELTKIRDLSREEEGCLFYDLYQDEGMKGRFALVMAFKDKSSYQSHISSPHIQKLEEEFGEILYHNVMENFYKKL